jgi:hypothetical protein
MEQQILLHIKTGKQLLRYVHLASDTLHTEAVTCVAEPITGEFE